VAQRGRACPAGVVEPGSDRFRERLRVFALGQERRGDADARRRFAHEQHTLGARELGDFVDQELLDLVHASQLVEPHPGVDEALERGAQICSAREMRGSPLGGISPAGRVSHPLSHDVAVGLDLVEIAAAQGFVAQCADAFLQHVVGRLQRLVGFPGVALGRQRTVPPPPDVGRRQAGAQRAAFPLAVKLGRLFRCVDRAVDVAAEEMGRAQVGVDEDPEARLLHCGNSSERILQQGYCGGAVALRDRDQGREPDTAERPDAIGADLRPASHRLEFGEVRACGGEVPREHLVAADDGVGVGCAVEVPHPAPDLDGPIRHPARMPVQTQAPVRKRQVVVDRRLPRRVTGRTEPC
jgi:hypothetical protein